MSSTFSQFSTVLVWVYGALMLCIPLFLILGVAQLALAIGLWNSDKRAKRLKRGVVLLLMAALMPLAQYVLWNGVLRPSMAADLMEQQRVAQEERHSATSLRRIGDTISELDGLLAKTGVSRTIPKTVVVNFFATWCGPCLSELPHLQQLADRYKDRNDILFVVVGREETQESIDAFVSKHGFRMQFVADPERKIYSMFAKELIPRTYLIDEHRTIRFEVLGFDEARLVELEAKLQEVAKP
jgi:thiol-disulfide isomerase/thioredoxin